MTKWTQAAFTAARVFPYGWELKETGVESLYHIPADFELTEIQRRWAMRVRQGKVTTVPTANSIR